MASADQMLRKAQALPSKERSDDEVAETPALPHTLAKSKERSNDEVAETPALPHTHLRKRHQYPGSGRATPFKHGSSEKSETRPGLPITTATLTPPLGQFVINLFLQLTGTVAAILFGIFTIESLNVAKQANVEARTANQVALLGICTQSSDTLAFCSRVLANKDDVFPSEVASLFSSAIPTSTTAGGFVTSSQAQRHTTSTIQTSRTPSSGSIVSSNPASIASSNSAAATSTIAAGSATMSSAFSTTSTSVETVGAPQPSATTSGAPSNSASVRPSTRIVIGVVVPVVSILLVVACTAIYVRRHRSSSRISGERFSAGEAPSGGGPEHDDKMGKESEYTESATPARGLKKWWKVYRALFLESTVSTH